MRKLVLLAAALPSLALAAPSAHDQLKETEAAIAQEKARQQELATQEAQTQKALAEVQHTLVRKAHSLRETENSLLASEEKIAALSRQQEEKGAVLQKHRAALAAMVSAAIRMSQMPPSAALLMPGDLGNTLKASRILASLTASIKQESAALNAQLLEMDALQQRLKESRAHASAQQKQLKMDQIELSHRLNERKTLMARLDSEQSAVKTRLTNLNQRASSLKDLIGMLEKQRKEEESRHRTRLSQGS
ncbi:MAG: hypothetical protein JO089_05930, partial [Alphaproteobacteria bacterium]|nr:hypothetical protein [Alphaproteobacteria bacterium]